MKPAVNKITIVGILEEKKNIQYGSYVKDGKTFETITGEIIVRVPRENRLPASIPISLFAQKYIKDSHELTAGFKSLDAIKGNYHSIAEVGEDAADKVIINGAQVQMQEFYSKMTGNLISYPRIQTAFINKVDGVFKPQAAFNFSFVISSIEKITTEDERSRLKINAILPMYSKKEPKVSLMPLWVDAPKAIEVIRENWEKDRTYIAYGDVNYDTEEKQTTIPVDFGEPIVKTSTKNIREFIITKGSASPVLGEDSYDSCLDEVRAGIVARNEELKRKKENPYTKKAPKAVTPSTGFEDFDEEVPDLGF